MAILRVLATFFSGPFVLIGIIWVLQGIGMLPGSFMTGDIKWALIGAPLALAGGALVVWLNKSHTKTAIAVLLGLAVLVLGLLAALTIMANRGFDYRG
jgi:hypothetical protein